MNSKVCVFCGEKYYAKGLCIKCYSKERLQSLEVKQRIKSYNKKYFSRPEIKERYLKASKKYYKSIKGKKIIKKNREKHRVIEKYGKTFVDTFFKQFLTKKTWQKEGIETMSKLFSEIVCDLTNKQKCDLQETILEFALKNFPEERDLK